MNEEQASEDELTPQERMRLRTKRKNQHIACREYILAGRWLDAERYATERGFTVADARATSWDQGKTLPWPTEEEAQKVRDELAQMVPVPLPAADARTAEPGEIRLEKPAEPPPPSINGWPIDTEGIVGVRCKNQQFYVLELPDGRIASLYRNQVHQERFKRVKVRLVDAQGDARYEIAPELT